MIVKAKKKKRNPSFCRFSHHHVWLKHMIEECRAVMVWERILMGIGGPKSLPEQAWGGARNSKTTPLIAVEIVSDGEDEGLTPPRLVFNLWGGKTGDKRRGGGLERWRSQQLTLPIIISPVFSVSQEPGTRLYSPPHPTWRSCPRAAGIITPAPVTSLI